MNTFNTLYNLYMESMSTKAAQTAVLAARNAFQTIPDYERYEKFIETKLFGNDITVTVDTCPNQTRLLRDICDKMHKLGWAVQSIPERPDTMRFSRPAKTARGSKINNQSEFNLGD